MTMMTSKMKTMRMTKMKINQKYISLTVIALETITYLLKATKKLTSTIK